MNDVPHLALTDPDGVLRKTLWDLMRGPAGVVGVLDILAHLSREMAGSERDVRHNEHLAKTWEKLAKALDRASGDALPLLEIL